MTKVTKKKQSTNKSKDVLFAETKVLRKEVKSLKEKLKEVLSTDNGELGDNPHIAMGMYKDGRNYMMIQIAYNPETKAVKILSQEPASRLPEASHMAVAGAENFLADVILDRLG